MALEEPLEITLVRLRGQTGHRLKGRLRAKMNNFTHTKMMDAEEGVWVVRKERERTLKATVQCSLFFTHSLAIPTPSPLSTPLFSTTVLPAKITSKDSVAAAPPRG